MATEKKVIAKKTSLPKDGAVVKKKKRTHATQKYASYIHKVLKITHADIGISSRAMSIMNSFIYDIFHRICNEAGILCKINKVKTMSSREVQTAVRLLLPGELAKHGINEASKALAKFQSMRAPGA